VNSYSKIISILTLIFFLLQSCQSQSPTQEAISSLTPSTSLEKKAMATQTAVPQTAVSLLQLLEYLPSYYGDVHLPAIGPWIVFLDFERMRSDLGIQFISGNSTRQEKLLFLTGMKTQNLKFIPDGFSDIKSGNAYTELGWDIADVDQSLYLPEINLAILKGRFEAPEIQAKLMSKGYKSEVIGDFTLFSDNEFYSLAWKPDTLIIANIQSEIDFAKRTIEFVGSENQSLSEHSIIKKIIPILIDSPWGIVLLPSPDFVAFDKQTRSSIEDNFPPETAGPLLELMGTDTPLPAKWDFMTAAYVPDQKRYTIRLMYNYPTDVDARSDEELVRSTLTEMPSLKQRGALWKDLVSINDLSIQNTMIVVSLQTDRPNLLGDCINGAEWGLLPIRYDEQSAN